MHRPIRVAVANRPRLMRELIVATIGDEPDIEIVAEIEDERKIADVVGELSPEFLIIALDQPEMRPPLCDALLRLRPAMKILAVGADGSWTVFYWASVEIHTRVFEASEKEIINTLRSHAGVGGG
jgi:chemotaxis response regulator CheB